MERVKKYWIVVYGESHEVLDSCIWRESRSNG